MWSTLPVLWWGMDASTSLLGVFAFTLLPEYHAVPAIWSVSGLAPAGSRPWNLSDFQESEGDVLKLKTGEESLKIEIYWWDNKKHTWRMGFSFPSNSSSKMCSKCDPIIRWDNTWQLGSGGQFTLSKINRTGTSSKNQSDKDTFCP